MIIGSPSLCHEEVFDSFFFFLRPREAKPVVPAHMLDTMMGGQRAHLLQLSVVTSIRRGPDVKDSYIGFSEGSRADV